MYALNALELLWNNILRVVTIINFPTDILDILIVTFLIYKVLTLSKTKSAAQIIKAVLFLLVLGYASNALHLNTLYYIISKTIEVGLIALVVVFQPELRRLLERVGGSSLKGILTPKTRIGDSVQTVEQTVAACQTMSRQKIGALIVFEKENKLDEYFKTGTVVDAAVSAELLKNIFFPKAALHDGAVVVRNDRIAAAGCVLPLTENPNLSRELGTRHRAAIGISEHSDAIVVVVSEETGVISCAAGGSLRRYLTPESLSQLLRQELVEEEQRPVHHRILEVFGKRKKEMDDSHEDQ
jgi:diadenylate cyclase